MTEEGTKRKLTAILSADVKEYSRLMSQDERSTIRTLTAYREAMSQLIQDYKGRVVDSPGDNLLAEFGSVVDAVNCAVEIQRDLAERNAELPPARQMEFRIGINLGDVVEEEGRIYGDGVNIAARIESLAEGGGICISGKVHKEVKTRLGLEYEYLGEQTVKNIPEPVEVYRVLSFPGAAAHRVIKAKSLTERKWLKAAIAATTVLVLGVVIVAIWHFYFRPPPMEVASVEKMAYPLPDKPSIAVLPFTNMSGDPTQDYFSDGLTEQIISTLSKLRNLFVIARNSTFTYKGKPVKVQKVAEDLGVKYVLEGSVKRSADQIRITAQLIDATTGHHVWSEHYDRKVKDIFAIQDDITLEIAKAMRIKLIAGEQARLWERRTTTNLKAYEKYLQGRNYSYRSTKEDNTRARRYSEEAIALDPRLAGAYVTMGWTHFKDARFGWTESRTKSIKMAFKYAQKALELDNTTDDAYNLMSVVYLVKRQHDKAVAMAEHALTLNPNGANVYSTLAGVVGCSGRWEESIIYGKKSMRLEPFPPLTAFLVLGRAYFMTGQYDEAILTFNKAVDASPNFLPAHAFLAACYNSLDRPTDSAAEAAEVFRINPKFCLESYAKTLPYKNKADIDRYIAALRKAGLPETPSLPLPDKPSIAVLPFTNISEDPKQDYFADGMTEDLITDLSKISELFVIARNSVFTYKGKPVKVDQISRELGVRYVLEGSVRKADDRVRINAQLIDATTGGHLWAERYDGTLSDIFSLQDKVTQKIVTALAVKLTAGEEEQITHKGTDNIAAYDAFLQGWQHYRRITLDDLAQAVTHLKKAIELDPDYGRAHAALAGAYWLSYRRGWNSKMDWPYQVKMRTPLLAHEHLDKALKSPTSLVHQVASWMLLHEPLHEEAISEAEQAIALNPNDVDNLFSMARALIFGGRADEGANYIKKAMRLDPHYPAQYLWFLGLAQFCMGHMEAAALPLERAHKRNPELEVYPIVVTYAHLGREEEAADILAKYWKTTWEERKDSLRMHPRVRWVLTYYPFKNQTDTDRFVDGLRKAGVPLKKATLTIPLDPYCTSAYELMAYAHLRNVWFGRTTSPEKSLDLAQQLAQKGIALDESNPRPRAVLGLVYLMKRHYEEAIAEGERAVALDPNNPNISLILWPLSWTLRYAGRLEEAIMVQKKALDLNPWATMSGQLYNLGMAYFTTRRYEEAISAFKEALDERPKNQFAWMGLAAAYTYLSLEEDAHAAAAELLRIDPTFSLEHYAKILPFKKPDDRNQFINALRKAGLK
jgi:adenylate cyclase